MKKVIAFPLSDTPFKNWISQSSLFMIGLSTAGKSTIGQALATQLEMNFIDGDTQLVRSHEAKNLSEVTALYTPRSFIKTELTMMTTVANMSLRNLVFAPGGSAIYHTDFLQSLIKSGTHFIYIKIPEEKRDEMIRNIGPDKIDEIVGSKPGLSLLEIFLEREERLQALASLTIESHSDSVQTMAIKITELLQTTCMLSSEVQ